MKNKITAFIIGLLCLTLLVGLIPAISAQEENVIYEYALLGDVYVPEDGLVSVTAPDGREIPADSKQIVLDWAQGSYVFTYPSKTVNVKVYELAPADNVTVKGQLPETVSAGLATQFPGCTAVSPISRTDGAPDIAPYSVSAVFWFDGQRVQTVPDVVNSFSFTPNASGLWMLSYTYKDVFGRVRTLDYPFTVTNDRIIISAVPDTCYVGNSITLSDAYGYYNGKQVPVSMSLEAPDGTVIAVKDRYVLPAEGSYILTSSAELEGEKIERVQTIEVKSGLQSFLTGKEGFTSGHIGNNHANMEDLTDSDTGLLLDMTSSTAGFTYNGVVDLNKLGKNTPVISFNTNHSYGGSISKVTVTLTDIYEPSNSVSVSFSRNSDMTATAKGNDNVLVQAAFGGTTVAVGNYYPLKDSSVSWNATFNSFWASPSNNTPGKTYNTPNALQPLNFAFDVQNNTVYSYGNYYLVEWDGKVKPEGYPTEWDCRWYPIADLDNSNLTNKFKGFTTGEVYVKLQVDSGRGDVMIHSIGGVDMNNLTENYLTDTGILLGSFDGSLPAAIGVPYAISAGSSSYIKDLSCKVTLNGEEVAVADGTFTPEKEGTYTVTYTGVNQFGNTVSKTVKVEAIKKPELTVSYKTENVKLGDVYTVGTPAVTGYGDITTVIKLNDEIVAPGQKLTVTDNMVITVTSKDYLDTVEKTFQLKVDKNLVTFGVDFPRSAVCGSEFAFPEANIVDHLSGDNLAYEVYVGGKLQTEKMSLSAEPATLKVLYRTARGSKSFQLNVRKGEALTGAEALLLPSGSKAETNDAGTMVTVSAADPVVRLPYKLSATSLPFQFVVLEEQLTFNTMTLRLTDGEGTAITASIVGLQEAEPHLYVNGRDTLVRVSKQAQTFTSGVYEGKTYYAYTMEYHDMYRAMLNAAKIEAYVETTQTGIAFQGFAGGVYLDIIPQDIQGSTAAFGITQIGNQYFYTSAFEYGDIVPPALNTADFFIGNNYVDLGYVLKLKDLKAYDVLQPEAAVEVTFMFADGTVGCQSAAAETVADITVDQVGTHTLKIKAQDAAGCRLDVTYRITVADPEPPEITVSGELAETAQAHKGLKIPGASASANSAVRIRVVVLDPHWNLTELAAGDDRIADTQIDKLQAGIYHVRYIATDEWDNVTTLVYTVTVEE